MAKAKRNAHIRTEKVVVGIFCQCVSENFPCEFLFPTSTFIYLSTHRSVSLNHTECKFFQLWSYCTLVLVHTVQLSILTRSQPPYNIKADRWSIHPRSPLFLFGLRWIRRFIPASTRPSGSADETLFQTSLITSIFKRNGVGTDLCKLHHLLF